NYRSRVAAGFDRHRKLMPHAHAKPWAWHPISVPSINLGESPAGTNHPHATCVVATVFESPVRSQCIRLRPMSDDASLPVVRRRRWPRIVALLLLLAVVGGFVFWLVKPQTSTATALFEVRREVPSVTANQLPGTDQDFELLRKTQIATLKAKFLLTSALRDPGISSLSILAGIRDPE